MMAPVNNTTGQIQLVHPDGTPKTVEEIEKEIEGEDYAIDINSSVCKALHCATVITALWGGYCFKKLHLEILSRGLVVSLFWLR